MKPKTFTVKGRGTAWWIVSPSGEILKNPFGRSPRAPLMFVSSDAAIRYCLEYDLTVGHVDVVPTGEEAAA